MTRTKGRTLLLAAALVVGVLAAGPADARGRGGLATVRLETIPPGARVVIRGRTVGTTPTRLQVPPRRSMPLTLRKKGFEPERVELPPLRKGQVRNLTVRLRPRRPPARVTRPPHRVPARRVPSRRPRRGRRSRRR